MYKFLACLSVLGMVTTLSGAAQDRMSMGYTIDATVVSVSGNQLVVEDDEGNERDYTVLLNLTKVVLDGKEIKLDEVKKGMLVRVTNHRFGNTMMLVRLEVRRHIARK